MNNTCRETPIRLLTLFAVLALALCAAFVSCENANIPGDDDPTPSLTGKKYKVNIVTRATGSEIIYPVTVWAKDASGNTVARQTLDNAEAAISLKLPEGRYRITAVCGATDFSHGYSTTPSLVGNSDITVKSSSVNVNIVMSYTVASVSIFLRGVPATVTAASVSLSPLYSSLDGDGTPGGTTTVSIPCQRQSDGTWATGTAYVLPASGTSTVLTLSLTSPTGTESYGVTYASALRASVPYTFTGQFSGSTTPADVKISGTLTGGTWEADVRDTFSFGPTGGNAFGHATTGDVVSVTALPQPGTVCDGHIVASITSEGTALLLSTQEWSNLTSAYYEADPGVAQSLASNYTEGTLTGWAIPSREEAETLRDLWGGSSLAAINASLTYASLTPLSAKDEKGDNVRYLCDNATYTFSFAANSQFTAAGRTVKTYRLRLVKPVRFVVR